MRRKRRPPPEPEIQVEDFVDENGAEKVRIALKDGLTTEKWEGRPEERDGLELLAALRSFFRSVDIDAEIQTAVKLLKSEHAEGHYRPHYVRALDVALGRAVPRRGQQHRRGQSEAVDVNPFALIPPVSDNSLPGGGDEEAVGAEQRRRHESRYLRSDKLEAGFTLGFLVADLKWKIKHERDAISGETNSQNVSAGGKARALQHSNRALYESIDLERASGAKIMPICRSMVRNTAEAGKRMTAEEIERKAKNLARGYRRYRHKK